jgi:DNA-binding transcriptional regulator LsrR (DeoR family)
MAEKRQEFNPRTDVQSSDEVNDTQLLGRVASLYYEHELTHADIGKLLGISRIKVTRLLSEARESGIVQIQIIPSGRPFDALELGLTTKFNLSQAWVVPNCADHESLLRSLGKVAARSLKLVIGDGSTVAVGFSRSVGAIGRYLRNDRATNVSFISLVGSHPGINDGYSNTNTSVANLARAMGGAPRHIPAPLLAGDGNIAIAMLSDPSIAKTIQMAKEADVLLVGIGGMTPKMSLFQSGQISKDERLKLRDSGAVGDISARFFDGNGSPILSSVDERVIGARLSDFHRIPVRIGVAAGEEKRLAILSAIHAGFINQLVTDAATAKWLIENTKQFTEGNK